MPRVSLNPDFSFAAARKAVSEIKEKLEELGREELLKISKSGGTCSTSFSRHAIIIPGKPSTNTDNLDS